MSPPQVDNQPKQKTWDTLRVSAIACELLEKAKMELLNLLAACCGLSGTWLNIPPILSPGLCMYNKTFQEVMGVHFGTSLCWPHACQRYGSGVNHLGLHELSCHPSEGRHFRHAAINDIVQQTFHLQNWNQLAFLPQMVNDQMGSPW